VDGELSVSRRKPLCQVSVAFSDLDETCVGRSGFYGFHFTSCFRSQLPFGGYDDEICRPAASVRSAVANI
jgi:hypothetical protein